MIASYAGEDRHPSWWLNLQAEPMADVQIRSRRARVRAREASGEERQELWDAVRGDRRRVRGVHAAHEPGPAGRGARADRPEALSRGERTSEAAELSSATVRAAPARRRDGPARAWHASTRAAPAPRPTQPRISGSSGSRCAALTTTTGGFERCSSASRRHATRGRARGRRRTGPRERRRPHRRQAAACGTSRRSAAPRRSAPRSRARGRGPAPRWPCQRQGQRDFGVLWCSSHAAVVRRKAVSRSPATGRCGRAPCAGRTALGIGAVANELGDVGQQLVGVEAARALDALRAGFAGGFDRPQRRGLERLVQDRDVLVQICPCRERRDRRQPAIQLYMPRSPTSRASALVSMSIRVARAGSSSPSADASCCESASRGCGRRRAGRRRAPPAGSPPPRAACRGC